MSKILLIEPSRMLQHAFVLALFPEHDVEIIAEPRPAMSCSLGVDLAIIDAAALRQRNALITDLHDASGGWELPTIWIDTTSAADSASSRMIQLALPFSREELRAAVAKLLHAAPAGKQLEAGRAHAPAAASRRGRSPKPVSSDHESGKKIIELVEVVEEADEHYDSSVDADSRD
jgi:hypothetical protein